MGGGIIGGKRGRDFRSNSKEHMDKTKRGWNQGTEVGWAEWWGENADNCT